MTRRTKDTPAPKTKWVQILIVTGVVVGGATALCYYKLRTSPRPTPVAWRGNTASRNRGNGVGAGGAARRPTAQAAKQAWNPDVLTRGLRDMNDAAQAQALAKISEWVSVDPASAAWPLENQWGKYLLASRHYQEAADMALACILEVPTNSDLVCGLLRLRARALLGQGKPAEALQCAKSLYNLSPLDRADEALYLVAFCLAQAQPADPGLYQRFCQEQQRGAAAAPTLPSSPLMASIHVDPAPYAPILARAFDDSDNQSILAYANMALAADQPAKARETFALLAHQDANRLVDIAARLMKAEDGTVGRANAYVAGQVAAAGKDQPIRIKSCKMPWPLPAKPLALKVAAARVPFGVPELERAGRITVPLAKVPFMQTLADQRANRITVPTAMVPFGIANVATDRNRLAVAGAGVPFGASPASAAAALPIKGVKVPVCVLPREFATPWQVHGATVPLGHLPPEFATAALAAPAQPQGTATAPAAVKVAAAPPKADPRELLTFYMKQFAPSGQPTLASWSALAANRPKDLPADLMPPVGEGHFVMSLCQDLQGRIWVGCEDEGVWCWDPTAQAADQWRHFTRKNTGGPPEPNGATIEAGNWLGDDNGYAVACDKLGRIWVGHLNHGVSVYNGRQWKNYGVLEGPLGERVFAIATCPTDGDVWIATSAGLTRYSLSNDTWSYYTRAEGLPSDQASAIAFDKDGNIIVGTQCDGLAFADAKDDYKTWRQVVCPKEYDDRVPLVSTGKGLPTNLINDVKVADDGTIYVATTTGLAWSKDGGTTFEFLRGHDWADKVKGLYGGPPAGWTPSDVPGLLPEDYLTCLALDGEGRVWVATRQAGLARIKGGVKTIADLVVPNSQHITALGRDGQAGLALGQYGHGVAFITESASSPVVRNAAGVARGGPAPLPAPMPPPTLAELNGMVARLEAASTRPAAASSPVIVLADDWTTRGQWLGRYGRYWICLAATVGARDFIWGTGASNVSYCTRMGPHRQPGDFLRYWIQWNHTANPGSLELPMPYLDSRVQKKLTTWAVDRRQSEWDDHGETYAQTFDGPDIYCTVHVPPGVFVLSFYDMNKDGHSGVQDKRDFRMSLRICDGARTFHDAPALACGRIRDFWGGVYKRFQVRGPIDLTAKIGRHYSFDTILAAVMLDRIAEHQSPYSVVTPADMSGWPTGPATIPLPIRGAPSPARLTVAEIISRVLATLEMQRPTLQNADSRQLYAAIARLCQHELAQADTTDVAAWHRWLGSCCYHLHLYEPWEEEQRACGLLTARQIERGLRWTGRPNPYPGEDRDLVQAYCAAHTELSTPPAARSP